LAVEAHDPAAFLETGLRGRAVLLDRADGRAARIARGVLDRDAQPTAAGVVDHHALVDGLVLVLGAGGPHGTRAAGQGRDEGRARCEGELTLHGTSLSCSRCRPLRRERVRESRSRQCWWPPPPSPPSVWNEWPQPQVDLAFGFLIAKPPPIRSSL